MERPPPAGTVMSKSMPAKVKRFPERTSSTITVPLRRPKPVRRWPSRPDFSMRSSQMPRRRKGESSGSGGRGRLRGRTGGGLGGALRRVLRQGRAKTAGGERDLTVFADLQRHRGADKIDAADGGPPEDRERVETERHPRHGDDAAAVRVVDDDVPRLHLHLASGVPDHGCGADGDGAAVPELVGKRPGNPGVTRSSPMPPRWICQESRPTGIVMSRKRPRRQPMPILRRSDQQLPARAGRAGRTREHAGSPTRTRRQTGGSPPSRLPVPCPDPGASPSCVHPPPGLENRDCRSATLLRRHSASTALTKR